MDESLSGFGALRSTPLLAPKERMKALYKIKSFIEENLCKELNLFMVQVPLIVSKASGVNDYLDRDGSRTPIDFPCGLGVEKRIEAQVVQAAAKWKRPALEQLGCDVGEGICTDTRAVRKDYFLDHDHSSYVDQWEREKVIRAEDRNLDTLRDVVERIWKVIHEAGQLARKDFPALATDKYDPIPEKDDGYPHEMRAADYDDWTTPTISKKESSSTASTATSWSGTR